MLLGETIGSIPTQQSDLIARLIKGHVRTQSSFAVVPISLMIQGPLLRRLICLIHGSLKNHLSFALSIFILEIVAGLSMSHSGCWRSHGIIALFGEILIVLDLSPHRGSKWELHQKMMLG